LHGIVLYLGAIEGLARSAFEIADVAETKIEIHRTLRRDTILALLYRLPKFRASLVLGKPPLIGVRSITVAAEALVVVAGPAMKELLAGRHPLTDIPYTGRIPYFLQAARLCIK
jgi:hypothetical protein